MHDATCCQLSLQASRSDHAICNLQLRHSRLALGLQCNMHDMMAACWEVEAYSVLRAVAAIVACIGLHGIKVQQGVATYEALQLCCTEEVDGRAPTQRHEPPCEGLELHHNSRARLTNRPGKEHRSCIIALMMVMMMIIRL